VRTETSRSHASPRDERWEFQAKSRDELLRIGLQDSNVLRGPDQNRLDEQVQIAHLLGSLATVSWVKFPVRLSHAPNEVPDFQVQLAGFEIGIEVTKVAVPDVEHARALQNRGLNRTLGISSLLRRKSQPRSRAEIVSEGFMIQQAVRPLSLEEHRDIWLREAIHRLDEKTRVAGSDRFRHGQEDWLLLWDRIGTAECELPERLRELKGILEPRWRGGWYSAVVLQARYFDWQFQFRSTDVTRLPFWRI